MTKPSRLILITPPVADTQAFAPRLEAAMSCAADVACVILRVAATDDGTAKAVVRALSPIVQRRDAALLVERDARFAAHVDADGLHVSRVGPLLDEALESLRARKIVGVGGLRSRDDAMTAGESGVDYLMFGGPTEGQNQDSIVERVAWWAEIFNVPCVGYAVSPSHAAAVARAGAEFVALCEGLWDDVDQVAPTLAKVTTALAAVHEAVA